MDITVRLPSPIVLKHSSDQIEMLVGPGMDRVIVTGDGDIIIRRNGGSPLTFKLNVPEVVREDFGLRRID